MMSTLKEVKIGNQVFLSLFNSAAKLYQPCLKHTCKPFTHHETNNIITCILRIIIIITFNYFFEFDETYT